MNDMKYLVILESSDGGFSAYVPDLPGCIAAASTHDEVVALIREAIEFHIEGMKKDQKSIYYLVGDNYDTVANSPHVPRPTSQGELVDVQAAWA